MAFYFFHWRAGPAPPAAFFGLDAVATEAPAWPQALLHYPVTAPTAADDTMRAYFAITPV